jgi:hypothetical protein
MQTLLNRIAGGWVREKDVYAWYMRVPDFEAFIGHIRPVLEQRLADSGARGYTGEIKINFYDKSGLTLGFENGQLTTIRQAALPFESETAAFPWHMFLNMVFGRHSYNDLSDFLPDAWADAESAVLLDILFPSQPVWIMQVD